jgi:DNA-binding protein Fis
MTQLDYNTKIEVALNEDVPVSKLLDYFEARAVEYAMVASRYNQSKAALMLGISRGNFRAKLDKFFKDKYIVTRG